MLCKTYNIFRFLFSALKNFALFSAVVITLWGCTVATPPSLAELPGPYSSLVVEVYGFRTLQGELLLSLFLETEGFPDDSSRALVNLSVPVTSGRVHFDLPPLPFGQYSYSILHDENGNGTMDRSLLGAPLEGYAFANNLEGYFGPPEATAALFELGPEPQNHELRIRYFKQKGKGERPF